MEPKKIMAISLLCILFVAYIGISEDATRITKMTGFLGVENWDDDPEEDGFSEENDAVT